MAVVVEEFRTIVRPYDFYIYGKLVIDHGEEILESGSNLGFVSQEVSPQGATVII